MLKRLGQRNWESSLSSRLKGKANLQPLGYGAFSPRAGKFKPRALEDANPPTFNSDIDNLAEDVGENSIEVSKAGFSPEGGKSSRIWQITPENAEDLIASFPIIIGDCNYNASSSGKLNRTLPLADPLYAWMYASSIPTIEGYGKYTKIAADPSLEAKAFPNVAFWDQYRLAVESLPRPFPVLPDSLINSAPGSWFPETGGGITPVSFTYANEQNRFCTWDRQASSDYITQQKGQMLFSDALTGGPKQFQAMPRILLNNAIYTITWYYVPIRFAISAKSYLQRWRGRVNQNFFTGPDGLGFNPGELLYLNFSQKMFTPPVQNLVSLGGEGGTIISTEKFAHFSLQFLITQRDLAAPPTTPPTNKNYVVGGHNLLPWNDFLFHYASVGATGRPFLLSAPLETLFTDPDSPGGVP
jgi:hypothetical protein